MTAAEALEMQAEIIGLQNKIIKALVEQTMIDEALKRELASAERLQMALTEQY
ncbi:hypothetical protein [Megasphaera elsdenii]|uniref:hypothetical protein n=1 Tax=Megasphaera elsdenii TaxID=907 RepID=UPI00339A0902